MKKQKGYDIPDNAITIRDENTGEEITISTVRTVREIADYLKKSEKISITKKIVERRQ